MIRTIFNLWHQHLAAKILSVIIVFGVLVAWISVEILTRHEQEILRRQIKERGQTMLELASLSASDSLLTNDHAKIEQLVETLANEPHVTHAVVRRHDRGVSRFTRVTQGETQPFATKLTSNVRVSSANKTTTLGEIEIGLVTLPSDRLFQSPVLAIAFAVLITLAPMTIVLLLLLRRLVGKRLRSLVEQTVRLGNSKFNEPISVATDDELGGLALTLDEVRRNLQQSYQELGDQNERLIEADRLKDEFLANMSHEIRTPMTAILGFADVLGESATTGEEREAVETVKRNGEHLLTLINDILDLSKIQAGKFETVRETCSPIQVVSDVASLMRVRANEKGFPLVVDFQGGIPAEIQSDMTRLRQVLINLVGNAIKFTETGQVRIVTQLIETPIESNDFNELNDSELPIEVERPNKVEKPSNGLGINRRSDTNRGSETNRGLAINGSVTKLRFEVIDTGIGMEPKAIRQLFQPFYQVDSSVARIHGGTGLGLAISKNLAQLLDGDLRAESQVGQGSRFVFEVSTGCLNGVRMIKNATEASVLRRPSNRRANIKPTGDRLTARVLLVEDGPDNQRLISHVLRKAGANVTIRENGKLGCETALAAEADGEPFDLVLMDMQMPVMDGYAAVRALREQGYFRPVVALTAYAMVGDDQKCFSAGCDGYLTKPINPKLLIGTLQDRLENLACAAC